MRSIEIDVRFDHGKVRVKRASGVADRKIVRDMAAMLRHLWNLPAHRPRVLEIAEGKRDVAELYIKYVTGRLGDVTPVVDDGDVVTIRDEWLRGYQASASHIRCVHLAFKNLLGKRATARLSEMPDLLEQYRTHCVNAGTPRAFNYAKHAILALLRDKFGRRHPLWLTVADIATMPEAKRGAIGMSVEDARAVRKRLPPEAAAIWWSMCCSGMGPTEFWGEWEALSDRVRIRGTKRPGRRWGGQGREVPLIAPMARPALAPGRFAKLLHGAEASPYRARKSYAMWLEDAEIPRTRRRLYMGHSAKDVTDLYERREITSFLAEDAARLLKVLGSEPTLALIKTHGLVVGTLAQEAG